jgi:peroxiredoxin
VIPLESPLLVAPDMPAPGATWSVGNLKHEFVGKEPIAEVIADPALKGDTWKVAASSGYGHKRHQWIDERGLVVRLSERVFMGQGEEYELTWKQAAVEQLAPEQLKARRGEFAALAELVAALKREPRTEASELKENEIAALTDALPAAEKSIADGPLAKLGAAAKSDLALQSGRASDVADLAARFVGKEAPKFSLEGLAGQKLSERELAGQVTVLHFWEYRDEPLREPYGQIGYLDFLYGKRKPDGVKVYGVAVDARLADAAKRGAAVRSAAKLVSFMNLSYPVLLDSGTLLKEFGDPRLVGAQLPLFVVIDAEGKIAHYFVGCYEVDRDAGLKRLNDVLTETIKKKS